MPRRRLTSSTICSTVTLPYLNRKPSDGRLRSASCCSSSSVHDQRLPDAHWRVDQLHPPDDVLRRHALEQRRRPLACESLGVLNLVLEVAVWATRLRQRRPIRDCLLYT